MIFTLNCRGRILYAPTPIVMGILNVTPDSFYTQGRENSMQEHVDNAGKMLEQGAAIIDIGGMSTRPGAVAVTVSEEVDRVVPVIEAIRKQFEHAFISVDTFRAAVAKQAVNAGVDIVNDISAGNIDGDMLATVAQLKVPYVAMHMQGTPETMQQNPQYENITEDVLTYFIEKINIMQALGIVDMVIDAGFGFGKTIAHNYELLKNMNALLLLGKPILVGVSRKSMAYKFLDINAEDALNATSVLHTLALQNGASILRVHDVVEAMQCIQIYNYYQTI